MVNTDKVVGFYTDAFGNEINEYEQIPKYTVCYTGFIFEGDTEGTNKYDTDDWDKAIEMYRNYKDVTDICIRDNEYDVTFENEDWR